MAITKCREGEVRVSITVAGSEYLRLRALLRQTIPQLRNPDRVSETERMALLQTVCYALDEASDEEDEPDRPEEP